MIEYTAFAVMDADALETASVSRIRSKAPVALHDADADAPELCTRSPVQDEPTDVAETIVCRSALSYTA